MRNLKLAFLDHASPAVGSTIASSPELVTLYFTEKLEPKFSGGEVRGPGGGRVDRGSSVSGNVMRLSIGGLRPGRYSVAWHALSVDTQKTQGSFSFQVEKMVPAGAWYAIKFRLSTMFKEE
jgi:methionine-rich copper-binding protein CopC